MHATAITVQQVYRLKCIHNYTMVLDNHNVMHAQYTEIIANHTGCIWNDLFNYLMIVITVPVLDCEVKIGSGLTINIEVGLSSKHDKTAGIIRKY